MTERQKIQLWIDNGRLMLTDHEGIENDCSDWLKAAGFTIVETKKYEDLRGYSQYLLDVCEGRAGPYNDIITLACLALDSVLKAQEGGESESEKIIADSLDVLDQDETEEKELPTMSNSERASYIRYRLNAAGCTIVKTVPKDGFTEAEYRQEMRREYAKAIKAQESGDD